MSVVRVPTVRPSLRTLRPRLVRPLGPVALVASMALTGCADLPPLPSLRIASASTSQTLCTAAFVSGLDPDRAYQDEARPAGGMGLIDWSLRYQVDRDAKQVSTSIFGTLYSRAVYRPGLGCAVVWGDTPPPGRWQRPAPAADAVDPFPGLARPAPPREGFAADERLRAAVDQAMAEDGLQPARRTQAIVVVHRGRIVAERYAADVGVDTLLQSHSMAKSVTHALIGVLAQQGRLAPDAPLPFAPWQQQPGDPHAAITPNQLLANASGLPWDERHYGGDLATRLWFDAPDPAAMAVGLPLVAAPGAQFGYSNAGWIVLSRVIRDLNGGSAAPTMDFVHRELLAPLGMQHTELTFDATGTPQGSNLFAASARDWARFGLLYLNDGVVAGRRLLPEGWVRDARRPTGDAGYGRGFWLNTTQAPHPLPGHWGMPGAPADAYFARGYLGQYIVIVPSRELVVVRLGISYRDAGDISGVGRLVGQISAALPPH